MKNDVADTRCELTELYRNQCAHCRRLPDPRPARIVGTWLKARYVGRCIECDYVITPGEHIRATGDGYLCTDCGRDYSYA